ncbi:MAG TPA: chemotaxis protein CheW [Zeimonas sp.]|nr:chemotaxis protein CheW [Zeimonas sp.]
MTTDRIDETASRSPPAARFGARLAGVAVAMPVGTSMEFVAAAAIYPLPLAPGRVAGLMQLRGQPLVVLDPATIPDAQGVIRRHDVLVVGQPPQAAALLVDAPPEPLPEGRWRAARGAPPDCAFAAALQDAPLDGRPAGTGGGREHPADAAGEGWYEIDPARLFDALTGR